MAEQARHLLNIPAVVNQHLDGHLDAREAIVDVLTELMHVAGEEGIPFDECLESARGHHAAEAADL